MNTRSRLLKLRLLSSEIARLERLGWCLRGKKECLLMFWIEKRKVLIMNFDRLIDTYINRYFGIEKAPI